MPEGSQSWMPLSSTSNPRGITPITVVVVPFTSMLRPTTPGSRPKDRLHSSHDRTASSAAPGRSSMSVHVRPIIGCTPSVAKRVHVAAAAVTRSGWSPPPTLRSTARYPATDSSSRDRSWSSRYSGGDIQNS